MRQFNVSGMGCAACQARVEKAVSGVDGVSGVAVSLLTNSMGVEGTADDQAIIDAVEAAGYGARLKAESVLEDRETPMLKKRLIASVGFLILLMYVSMGHGMLGLPLPVFLENNFMASGVLQMILAIIVMIINGKFFTSGFSSLLHRAPNMDTLVAMGSGVSFLWSVAVLIGTAVGHGDVAAGQTAEASGQAAVTAMHMSAANHLYFETAAMIVTLITVGKMLEAMSKGRTTNALKGLMNLAPKTAILLEENVEKEVSVDQVKIGDIFVVRPGESIPVDGVILEGDSAVDESALSGESIPVDKYPGDSVSAATINRSGFIKAKAVRVGEDTTLSQIIQMVSDAAATKAPIAKAADKVSGIFVPAVMIAALITLIIWLAIGAGAAFALTRAVAVLVISCPCALGLATPVAIMVGNGIGAKNGILFKTAAALETTGKSDVIVLDKTGTITKGEPELTDILCSEGVDEEELISMATALEAKSEHPLAKAILAEVEARGINIDEVTDFRAVIGNGLRGRLAATGTELAGGKLEFITQAATVDEQMKKASEAFANEGKTCLYFARENQLLGMIAVADTIKEDSPEAIISLKEMGLHVVMLTGDNEQTAEAIAVQAGVDEVIAGVKPDGKEAVIRDLQEQKGNGQVIMVGDGINDAPALTRADTGIAIGAGTDVAIDAADVVLMNSRLSDVVRAIRLSRATVRNIHQNLFWAFIYNVLLIPLAAGAYTGILGWTMNPMIGAAAMSLSSFCVVMNALRLNGLKLS